MVRWWNIIAEVVAYEETEKHEIGRKPACLNFEKPQGESGAHAGYAEVQQLHGPLIRARIFSPTSVCHIRSSGTNPESKVKESPRATMRYVPSGLARSYSCVRKPKELSLKPADPWNGCGW